MLFFSPVRVYCHLGQVKPLLSTLFLFGAYESQNDTFRIYFTSAEQATASLILKKTQKIQEQEDFRYVRGIKTKRKEKTHLSPTVQGPSSAEGKFSESGLLLL